MENFVLISLFGSKTKLFLTTPLRSQRLCGWKKKFKSKISNGDAHPKRNIFIKTRHPELISGSITILEVTLTEQTS